MITEKLKKTKKIRKTKKVMSNENDKGKIAIVKIRGIRKTNPKIRKTLELLRLNKPNHCVLVNNNPKMKGMINVIRDYVGFGFVSKETVFKLLKKRGEKGGKLLREQCDEKEIEKMAQEIYDGEQVKRYVDPVFRLHPPRKGHKNIKKAYPIGDLGKRKDMNEFIIRMI